MLNYKELYKEQCIKLAEQQNIINNQMEVIYYEIAEREDIIKEYATEKTHKKIILIL